MSTQSQIANIVNFSVQKVQDASGCNTALKQYTLCSHASVAELNKTHAAPAVYRLAAGLAEFMMPVGLHALCMLEGRLMLGEVLTA